MCWTGSKCKWVLTVKGTLRVYRVPSEDFQINSEQYRQHTVRGLLHLVFRGPGNAFSCTRIPLPFSVPFLPQKKPFPLLTSILLVCAILYITEFSMHLFHPHQTLQVKKFICPSIHWHQSGNVSILWLTEWLNNLMKWPVQRDKVTPH